MMLSFSIEAMRPMIVAGLLERHAPLQHLGDRVKRQTVRPLGTRTNILLERAARAGDRRLRFDLHCWWKSRTKERAPLGVARDSDEHPITIRPVTFRSDSTGGIHLDIEGDSAMSREVYLFARADGFDSVDEFRVFFLPSPGSTFRGALIKW